MGWTTRNHLKNGYIRTATSVDGSEIRRSPVEGTVIHPIIYRIFTSQVVQDFFQEQLHIESWVVT